MTRQLLIARKAVSNANALNVVRQACSEGLGITLMPDVMIREYIEDGSLVQVLEDWSANLVIFTCFYNHKDHLPEKVRLFIDFVIAYHTTKIQLFPANKKTRADALVFYYHVLWVR